MTAVRCAAPGPSASCSHLAVFSHGMDSAAASSAAAVADGARPTTVPRPWTVSQAARIAIRVVVLPVPAGPTSTSTIRPEVHACRTACT